MSRLGSVARAVRITGESRAPSLLTRERLSGCLLLQMMQATLTGDVLAAYQKNTWLSSLFAGCFVEDMGIMSICHLDCGRETFLGDLVCCWSEAQDVAKHRILACDRRWQVGLCTGAS